MGIAVAPFEEVTATVTVDAVSLGTVDEQPRLAAHRQTGRLISTIRLAPISKVRMFAPLM
jgi:hypothetical protein